MENLTLVKLDFTMARLFNPLDEGEIMKRVLIGILFGVASLGAHQAAFAGQPCQIGCSADLTQDNDAGECGAVVDYIISTVGACGTLSCTQDSGTFFDVGTTTVTCSIVGGPSCDFDITVNDVEAPVIQCPADINEIDSDSVDVDYTTPVATDNCPDPTVACDPASGSTFDVGTTTVDCTATDESGNDATCDFIVSVNPPVLPPTFVPEVSGTGLCSLNHDATRAWNGYGFQVVIGSLLLAGLAAWRVRSSR